MSPFEWLEQSSLLEDVEQRHFTASLDCYADEESMTYYISLKWTDRTNQSGEIFIPAVGIKRIHKALLELEKEGYQYIQQSQTHPP